MSNELNATTRPIRSFVRRTGRITTSQEKGLEEQWPQFGLNFDKSNFNAEQLFGRTAPLIIEIGFGNGDALLHAAKARPDINFMGIEVHKPGVGRLLNLLVEHEISNVRVCCEDAVAVLHTHIPDESLDAVHLYFPDPWPKKRHHKRRILQTAFASLVLQKLKFGGLFYMATDWAAYAEHMQSTMQENPGFSQILKPNSELSCYIERATTKFETRGRKLSHDIWDFVFKKNTL